MPRARKSAPAEEPSRRVETDEQDDLVLENDEALTWRPGKPLAVSELLRRLKALYTELAGLEQEHISNPQLLYPKAAELANAMLLTHKDKGVKAWTLACIVDMFRLTAPNAPYKPGQLKQVFDLFVSSVVPALASPSDPYRQQYMQITNSLTKVQSILLLADIPGSDVLIQRLFQNCFDVVSGNVRGAQGEALPKSVEFHLTGMLTTLIGEMESLPTGVDDCILAQFLRADPTVIASGGKKGDVQPSVVLKETSPAYNMARSICNEQADKMTRAVAQYFNAVLIDASETVSTAKRAKQRGKKRTYDESEDEAEDDGLLTPPAEEDLRQVEAAHRLLRELWRAAPDVIRNVIPQIEAEVVGENVELRTMAVEAIGDMIAGIGAAGPPPPPPMDPAAWPSQSLEGGASHEENITSKPHAPRAFVSVHAPAYQAFFDRHRDKSPQVRSAWVTAVGRIVSTSAGGSGLNSDQEPVLLRHLANAMVDSDEKVRLAAVQTVSFFDFNGVMEKLCQTGGVTTPESVLSNLSDRMKDPKRSVRAAAIGLMGRIWGVASGAIVEGIGHARDMLGAIPSKVFETMYVNDRDINALVYRSIFDAMLPVGFPPIKSKASQTVSSQRIGDSQGGAEQDDLDPDTIRTQRILALVRDLDEKAQKVFFALQTQQLALGRFMEKYLAACSEPDSETAIHKGMKGYLHVLAKPVADQQLAEEHLRKFATHHDRRSFQLIRFCFSAESDYRKITKALKELTKRLEEATSSVAVVLETLIPIVKSVSVLVYNKSHMPAIMRTARDDTKALGGAAHDLLKQISASAPDVFKVYVLELCNTLKNEAPTAESTPDPGAVYTLKACAGFAQYSPSEMPKDRDFFRAMVAFAKYGSPPEAAKHAVTVLVASADKKEMYINDLLKHCLADFEDFDFSSEGALAKLAALSQLKLVANKQVEDRNDGIMVVAAKVLGGITVVDDHSEVTNAGIDDELSAKLWALKLLVNDLRGQDTSGDQHEASARIQAPADRVYKLLNTLVENEGELSRSDGTVTPVRHKEKLRLAAGVQLLKLSCNRVMDQNLTPPDFNRLAKLAQDEREEVRLAFGKALKKYLGQGKLTPRFYALVFIYAFEPCKSFKQATETWIKSRAARAAAEQDGVIEGAFVRLLSLLAHHQDFKPGEVDDDFVEYIVFYLRNVATDENLGRLYHLAQRLKTVRDAITPDASERIYIISELAQATIHEYQGTQGWSMQLPKDNLRLPAGIFARLPDHETAVTVAETRYAPQELIERVEDLVKSSLSTRKKNKNKRKLDGVPTQAAKKAKTAAKAAAKNEKTAKAGTRKIARPVKTPKKRTEDAIPSSEIRKSARASTSRNYAESDSDEDEEDEPGEWDAANNSEGNKENVSSTPPTSEPVPDVAPAKSKSATIARSKRKVSTRQLPSRSTRSKAAAVQEKDEMDIPGDSDEELSDVPENLEVED